MNDDHLTHTGSPNSLAEWNFTSRETMQDAARQRIQDVGPASYEVALDPSERDMVVRAMTITAELDDDLQAVLAAYARGEAS